MTLVTADGIRAREDLLDLGKRERKEVGVSMGT